MVTALLTAVGLALLHSLWLGTLLYLGVRVVLPLLVAVPHRIALTSAALGLTALGFLLAIPLFYQLPSVCDGVVDYVFGAFPPLAGGPTSPGSFIATLAPASAPYLTLLYVGMLPLAFLRLYRTHRRNRLLRQRGLAPVPAAWQAAFAPADRPVDCYLSDYAGEVMTLGLRRPVVLFPRQLAAELSPAEASTIYLHETAHLRHGDHLANYGQQLLGSLLYFHPVVRALGRLIERERELRCDDYVVAQTDDRRTYAVALVAVARHQHSPANALALSATRSDFSDRVRRLFGAAEPPPAKRYVFAPLFAALLLFGLSVSPHLSPPIADCPGTELPTFSYLPPDVPL